MGSKEPMGTQSMNGKSCMITGCNSGIGKVVARELAALDATIIMVCRNAELGRKAAQEIKLETGNANVELMTADLSSQESINNLINDYTQNYDKLDVLINNAGILLKERTFTDDGIETQLAVNLLAPFMLSIGLLDTLEAAAPSRIVNVTSKMHRYSGIEFDNLQGEKKYSKWAAYNQAKLGVLLFSYELSRQLEGSGVTVNCVHPGVVATGIMRQFPAPIRLMWDWCCISPEKGAENSVYLASSPDVEGKSGLYYERMNRKESSDRSHDKILAKNLWNKCNELTGFSSH